MNYHARRWRGSGGLKGRKTLYFQGFSSQYKTIKNTSFRTTDQKVRGSNPLSRAKRPPQNGVAFWHTERGFESKSNAPAGRSSTSANTGRFFYFSHEESSLLRRCLPCEKCRRIPYRVPKEPRILMYNPWFLVFFEQFCFWRLCGHKEEKKEGLRFVQNRGSSNSHIITVAKAVESKYHR